MRTTPCIQKNSKGKKILDVKSDLLSHRKSEDLKVLDDLKQTHPSTELEARLLSIVWPPDSGGTERT